MAKMQLTVSPLSGLVTLSYDDDGERVTREFNCPIDGGYVREYIGSDTKQVCDKLARQGSTLTASRATLADVIRREYRAMRAAEKREAARYAY